MLSGLAEGDSRPFYCPVIQAGCYASWKMSRTEREKTEGTRCSNCHRSVPNYDIINLGSIENGYRKLCGQCFNAEAAQLDGLERFEHLNFEPIRVVDCKGRAHDFHFRTHLFGAGVALDAFELRDGNPAGYHFQIIDNDPEADLMALFGRLVEKIRRALSIKHLKQGSLGLQVADQVVRGRIEWDEDEDGRVPLLVIDGREITWDQFGRMLMTFEGWQFKLEIFDKSEEP